MEETKSLQLKRTTLYPYHKKANAKLVNFSGWEMPIEYDGILKETKNCRNNCALFDVSHMGEIEIKGENAHSFIQYLTTNNVDRLEIHSLQYNLFINEKATILDDFMLYHLGKNHFLCVVNASNKDKIINWLYRNKTSSVEIEDKSDSTALLSLQGPYAEKIMEKISPNIREIKYMHFIYTMIAGFECLVSRSGYTGEDGFELYCPNKDVSILWELLLELGKEISLSPAGLGARDILRIEAGYPLYGHEIDESTNPIEASLGWAVKVKEKDFVGKEKMLNILKTPVSRKRIGFVMEEKGVARQGYAIYDTKNNCIGTVTSGTYSPNLDKFIGMGYINSTSIENHIYIEIRGKLLRARIDKLPFIKINTKK